MMEFTICSSVAVLAAAAAKEEYREPVLPISLLLR